MYLSILVETFSVTGPIFVLVLLGLVLRRTGFIDDHFVQMSSRLVFSICLPLLLFTTIVEIELGDTINPQVIYFSIAATLVTFLLSWLTALGFQPASDRGIFVQGAFRSNLGVIGLALCANAYGDTGLAVASILIAVLTVAYNILSVLVLSYYSQAEFNLQKVIRDIVTNPLIVAIVLATIVALLQIPVPQILQSSGEYLGSLALPLALLGTGAALNLKALRDSGTATVGVVILKTALLPALVVVGALYAGFSALETGVLFLLFVSPTASASFAMVKAMGLNDQLAANLIMVTTLVTLFTASLGLFLLRVYGLA